LLLLARADAGALPLDLEPLQLDHLLRAVCEQFSAVAESQGLTLNCRIESPGAVLGDRLHLRRAIVNLVDNALKYTPREGRITLCLKSEPKGVAIEVFDTGMGISKAEQELIFSRFHRATDTRARDARGVGLGLSIARSIVEAHGGTLTVASTPGQGSTFAIHLPIQPS
ncbi:MAG: HAMP domain-containing sensor histidine kinase, partial [Desulfobacterales bacterium]